MTEITFAEACRLLQCRPDWLGRQLDRGLVRHRVVSAKPGTLETRYLVSEEDIANLPKPRQFEPAARRATAVGRMPHQNIEDHKEAQRLGLSLQEYLTLME